ncbi:glycine zipper 2TM domain-containing protein [Halobacterium noricense]|uniref:glycine zipper 2TM domain-containing protein n=1 Tax=Halobacterium noricense TaxID=223182 RepID=UPI001E59D912|nr:glycine zipper 2TM domain-containing protein [Halobacterium noricense]UHH24478.1 glycine zipper 2TM domain-containing protein [Halobacterium noricense]
MSRLKRVFSRAKYAAIGAAVGGALGGIVSRNAASTAAGVGALAGAIVGEKRVDVGTIVDDVKDRKPDTEVVSRSSDD